MSSQLPGDDERASTRRIPALFAEACQMHGLDADLLQSPDRLPFVSRAQHRQSHETKVFEDLAPTHAPMQLQESTPPRRTLETQCPASGPRRFPIDLARMANTCLHPELAIGKYLGSCRSSQIIAAPRRHAISSAASSGIRYRSCVRPYLSRSVPLAAVETPACPPASASRSPWLKGERSTRPAHARST